MDSNTINTYYSKEDLHNVLRLLWSQYVMWTRFALISRTSGTNDTEIIDNRLNEFPRDLAGVIAIYYGEEAAGSLQALLQENIKILLSIMESILADNSQETIILEQQWQENGEKISRLLHTLNEYYDEENIKNLLNNLLYMTEDEITKRKNKQYYQDVYQYDFIEYHSLMIADILWDGFIKKFY
ncbi:hypothetical protein acsn021_32450 [Anaerocolumna cellulosilytica]|uniref:Uncharacterized protein n=1 Tax=Anaerocolumna cellulosilytica TaxID=433286 RepID=A0A6S6R0V2_9FIRM|nr:hypothetical protein [Anaerocolumna cellulosilytica]MBB5196575.1 hypothetical protein [Anaerocolumna cellulosilytica]BCJ95676.1 hypothetical protein acsn021_32450 [Anaerocolumna cellulosilytica]